MTGAATIECFAPSRQFKRSIATRKPVRVFYSILILIIAVTLLSCVYRPSVIIKQGDPQQFILSAKGILDVFSVSGPVSRCTAEWNKDRLPRMERYWEIAPLKDFDVSEFRNRGPIVYGTVPTGFRQVTPVQGSPPPICEGGPYSVQLAIRNGGAVNMLFAVYKGGKIVTEADGDRWWKITP
jgi:hypothetical protein